MEDATQREEDEEEEDRSTPATPTFDREIDGNDGNEVRTNVEAAAPRSSVNDQESSSRADTSNVAIGQATTDEGETERDRKPAATVLGKKPQEKEIQEGRVSPLLDDRMATTSASALEDPWSSEVLLEAGNGNCGSHHQKQHPQHPEKKELPSHQKLRFLSATRQHVPEIQGASTNGEAIKGAEETHDSAALSTCIGEDVQVGAVSMPGIHNYPSFTDDGDSSDGVDPNGVYVGRFENNRAVPLELSGLVQARAVEPHHLPHATLPRADQYEEPAADVRETKQCQQRLKLIGGLASIFLILLALVLIILSLAGTFSSSTGSSTVVDTGTTSTSSTPVMTPTPAPGPTIYVHLPLTDETLTAIYEDPTSPQGRAYQWIIDDPQLFTYTEDRLLQRFALMTFYYATNIEYGWILSNGWESHVVNECEWFGKDSNDGVCDGNGNYIRLILTKNGLRGTLPPELSLLTHLQVFDVATNGIEGSVPSELGLLNLKSLELGDNLLTGTMPSTIGLLSNLGTLLLHRNSFIGMIPTELGHISLLRQLSLSTNQLTGPIPSELGLVENLQFLALGSNSLSSSIPIELFKNMAVEAAYFERNELTGTIASSIGKWSNLQHLSLRNNSFSGRLPVELVLLSDISTMVLSDTLLSGTIPAEFCDIPWLFFNCSAILCGCNCICYAY